MYHCLFVHSPVEGYLGCFQVLVFMKKAAINIHVQIFFISNNMRTWDKTPDKTPTASGTLLGTSCAPSFCS